MFAFLFPDDLLDILISFESKYIIAVVSNGSNVQK